MILRGPEGRGGASRRAGRSGALRGATVALAAGVVVVGAVLSFPSATVEVHGVPREDAREIQRAVVAAVGDASLLRVDAGAVEARLEALPTVQAARVDRAFPGVLAVRVTPEQPAAVVPLAGDRYLVGRSGRVIGKAPARTQLPFLAAAPADVPPPGGTLRGPGVRAELEVARAIPDGYPLVIVAVELGERGLVARTGTGAELRLGDADDLGAKLRGAALALAGIPRTDRRGIAYVDASIADRPAVRTATPNAATLAPPAPIILPEIDAAIADSTAPADDPSADPSTAEADAAAADDWELPPDVPALTYDLFGHEAAA